jgi:ubiquinone/menaquinone biosynthesis C-methylase UbiE
LPGVPDDDVQQRFTGSGGETTLREGWNVYRLVKQAYNRYSPSRPLATPSTVLDFGCGWGRIIRFFLKDIEPGNLFGIDCDSDALELCRRTNRWSSFIVVDALPPAPLPDAHFDLIYAYSVFSHLSEESHDRWLDEFRRILKPGGLLMVSTRPRSFIEKCAWLRTDAGADAPASHRIAAGAFPDTATALADYDAGAYCFSHRTDEDPPHFGETCIPQRYVIDQWTDRFHLLDFIDDHRLCEQNFVVARRA